MKFHNYLAKTQYWYVSFTDNQADVIFMNYGYADQEQDVDLDPKDEPHRYSIQLYHHMTKDIDLANKALVEIGCGRGGGLSYVARRRSPDSAIGIDISKAAVR